MAWAILIVTAVVSFFYLKEFRLHLFLLGSLRTCGRGLWLLLVRSRRRFDPSLHVGECAPFLAVGGFIHQGWLQGLVGNAHDANAPIPHPQLPRHVDLRYFGGMLALSMLAWASFTRRNSIAA